MSASVKPSSIRPKILVVDDSKLIRVAAEKILALDYDVLLANDGDEAWHLIQRETDIQVVFSDLTMPRLDGFTLLTQVRESDNDRIASLPLIIMTTDADDDSRREKALQLGATDFISKPFNSIDLKARAKAHALSEQHARELVDKNRELERNASKDELTGLSNRSYLLERLWQDRSYAVRNNTHISILRIDIDNFNALFVQCGKEFSKSIVKCVADAIKQYLRQEDTAARIGLSTFILVMPGATAEASQATARQIQQSVAEKALEHAGQTIPCSISIGIRVPSPDKNISVDILLEDLENLLDESLEHGDQRLLVREDEFSAADATAAEAATNRVPTVDQAIALVRSGQTDALNPYMEQLIDSMLPLLAASSEALKDKIRKAIE